MYISIWVSSCIELVFSFLLRCVEFVLSHEFGQFVALHHFESSVSVQDCLEGLLKRLCCEFSIVDQETLSFTSVHYNKCGFRLEVENVSECLLISG